MVLNRESVVSIMEVNDPILGDKGTLIYFESREPLHVVESFDIVKHWWDTGEDVSEPSDDEPLPPEIA